MRLRLWGARPIRLSTQFFPRVDFYRMCKLIGVLHKLGFRHRTTQLEEIELRDSLLDSLHHARAGDVKGPSDLPIFSATE